MDDLIKKLAEAKEGSRELDADIALFIDWKLSSQKQTTFALACSTYPGGKLAYVEDFHVPQFSTSIGAALTLVPEGWEGTIGVNKCNAGIYDKRNPTVGFGAVAATPALALCIAALQARSHVGAG